MNASPRNLQTLPESVYSVLDPATIAATPTQVLDLMQDLISAVAYLNGKIHAVADAAAITLED